MDKDDKDDKRYYDEAKYLEKRDEDNEDARTFTRNVDKKGKKIDKWQIVNPWRSRTSENNVSDDEALHESM